MSPNWRSRVGGVVSSVYPRLDRDVWTVGRIRHCVRQRRMLAEETSLLKAAVIAPDAPVHLVVVAHHGPAVANWHVAGGNHLFETHQSAVELLGASAVTLFSAAPDEPEIEWQRRFLTTLVSSGATHVLAQIENDPNQPDNWSWDVVAGALKESWTGTFIGFSYDSAFEWLRLRIRRIGRIYPRLIVADLCEPADGMVRRGQTEIGPMTMPLSAATVAAIDDRVHDLPKTYDVTFIGALYDYRVELIERLRAFGLDVAVNPHRPDATATYLESRTNQPTYLDYIAGLASSELTINFSLASGGPHEQYKIRPQEASLVGCLCLTDDRDRTRVFFAADQFAYFPSVEELPQIAQELLSDRVALHARQARARVRAHELATTDFWRRIDDGLRRRGLPTLADLPAPSEPS